MSSGNSWVNLSVSMIVGCLGMAPISSSLCTSDRLFAAASFAVLGAAGFAVGWALEGADPWDGEDWEGLSDVLGVSLLVDVLVVASGSLDVGGDPLVSGLAVCVSTTLVSIVVAVAGTLGVTGTAVIWFAGLTGLDGLTGLIGLTGLATFVGLVSDFTHESAVVVHALQTGCPYGSGQEEV
jgi:hypothetical protein